MSLTSVICLNEQIRRLYFYLQETILEVILLWAVKDLIHNNQKHFYLEKTQI